MKMILASSSPYRQALLNQIGFAYGVDAPRIDESTAQKSEAHPHDIARTLARLKGEEVAKRHPQDLIIASDQVAHLNREILGKPGSESRAIDQLKLLSGREHELVTALFVLHPLKGSQTHLDVTKIRMRQLSDSEIRKYIERDQPLDCAGAYKFERAGIALIEHLQCADPSAIEGLPLIALVTILRGWNIELPFT